jgi:hypothetical protein
MTILRANTISGLGTDGPVFDGSLEFNSQNYVILPKGTTDNRVGLGSTAGALRYNTDSNKVELWDGNQWVEVQSSRPDLNGGARGVFVGGYTGSGPTLNTANSDYINIASTGNALSFGDIAVATRYHAGCSSNTRGVWGGGVSSPGTFNTLYKTTISSTGSHASFGNLTSARYGHSAWSSQTRGLFFAGFTSPANTNNINYVTISSEGNGVTFGELVDSYNFRYGGATGNKTRGIAYGGYNQVPAAANVNNIQYVTISTLGNATDFGDLTIVTADQQGSTSNGLRSVMHVGTSAVTTLDQIRPSSLGNSYRFGDLTVARRFSSMQSCISSPTRGIFGSGYTGPGFTNTIDYVTFATEGNAVDFGDAVGNSGSGYSSAASFSNAHGGL